LKPDNLLIGIGPRSHRIHIIDFGLSNQYRDPDTNIHIPYRDNLPLIGTARYASVNAHMGIEHSRRDDMESLAYILIYFMQGCLPWKGITIGEKRQADIGKKKSTITPEVLCDGLPAEFHLCLQYARSLGFSERPNYQYLRDLFSNLHRQHADNDSEIFTLSTALGRSRVSTSPPSNSTKTETPSIPQVHRVQGIKS
jgi:casein kinase I family protein HRR25